MLGLPAGWNAVTRYAVYRTPLIMVALEPRFRLSRPESKIYFPGDFALRCAIKAPYLFCNFALRGLGQIVFINPISRFAPATQIFTKEIELCLLEYKKHLGGYGSVLT